jgi:hypothetical protein
MLILAGVSPASDGAAARPRPAGDDGHPGSAAEVGHEQGSHPHPRLPTGRSGPLQLIAKLLPCHLLQRYFRIDAEIGVFVQAMLDVRGAGG